MVEQLEQISRTDLASRLTLNCTVGPLNAPELPIDDSCITIIDTLDDVGLPEKLREEVYKVYPNARQAMLKTGGNFPYLSRSDEVNMHIEVHLRLHKYESNPESSSSAQTNTSPSSTEQKDHIEEEDN
eukprot:TRINITY_DN2497_c0_g1_i1.p2 TRINITY_DN2497_c0_g1~~TRINITY_DN2497_c0_g1_i1.p2  ORF type:complete len:128 (-),score=32.75 TRINITY_DN2497_c0_g1_i1:80-463(-)